MIVEAVVVAVGATCALVGVAAARWSAMGRVLPPWVLAERFGPSVRVLPTPEGFFFVEVLQHDPPATVAVVDGRLVASLRAPQASSRLTELTIDDDSWHAGPATAEVRLRSDHDFAAAIQTLQRAGERAHLEGELLHVSTTGGHARLPRDLAPLLAPLFHDARCFFRALERAVDPLATLDGSWRAKTSTSTSASSGSPFVVRG